MGIVRGDVAPGFERVRDLLEAMAGADSTYCAQYAAYVEGDRVADLSCGPWPGDALLPIFSCSKGAVAATIALVVARGQIDLDARVADYWPDFAAKGKAAIEVRQLLSHQAGVMTVDGGYCAQELLEHSPLAERLAAQR